MAMDLQTTMERFRELYQEKNDHMQQFLEPVTPYDFYREIFPVGSFERKGHFEDSKGNGISVTIPQKDRGGKEIGVALEIEGDGRAKRHLITDDLGQLAEIQDTDFSIMSPISYFGKHRSGKNARYLYAIAFDLDGVGMPQLRDTLHQMNKVGHRFYGIMTLAIYAKKCDIDEDELRHDAFGLLQTFDDMSVEDINRFTKDDIVCALEMFNEDYVTFPRDDIARISGLKMPVNKRNWRKQSDHIKLMNFVRDEINGNRDWRNREGRPSKREEVFEYMRNHPEVKKKTEIAKALQIDRGTVAKYFAEIQAELAEKE